MAEDRITTRKGGFYRCNKCKVDFTVRTGTIFEWSHVPLHKWVYAMYLVVTARKGVLSLQLAKEIGVTHKLHGSCSSGYVRLAPVRRKSSLESWKSMNALSAAKEANKHECKKLNKGPWHSG